MTENKKATEKTVKKAEFTPHDGHEDSNLKIFFRRRTEQGQRCQATRRENNCTGTVPTDIRQTVKRLGTNLHQ